MLKFISKNGFILACFALVTSGLIAITFAVTQERIVAQQERQLISILNELIPPSAHTNNLHTDCIIVLAPDLLGNSKEKRIFRARDGDTPIAAILESTAPNGYSGNIDMVVGVNTKLVSMGARVTDHQETPGLGDKIELRISDWIKDFTGVKLSEDNQKRWQVKKDGGQFDQFTGATITPRAVVQAVKNTLLYFKQHQHTIFSTPSNCHLSGNTHE